MQISILITLNPKRFLVQLILRNTLIINFTRFRDKNLKAYVDNLN